MPRYFSKFPKLVYNNNIVTDILTRVSTIKPNIDNTAIFYTIWSYKPGAGRQLIFDSVQYIKSNKPNISRFVTLSPKTEMARRFHLKNGAIIFRENIESINYEYTGNN